VHHRLNQPPVHTLEEGEHSSIYSICSVHFHHKLDNEPEFSTKLPWRSPELSHFMWHCGRKFATLAPNVGPSRNEGHTVNSKHQLFPGSVGCQWGPTEDGAEAQLVAGVVAHGGCCAATPATSLEQPTPSCASARKDSSRRPHAPGWRWGIEPRRLVEGGPTGGCSRPSNKLYHDLAANPLPSPPRQPPVSRMEREGGWLTMLGM